jgi:hypothetical protein
MTRPTDYMVTRGREHDQTHRLPGYQGPRTWPDPQTTMLQETENSARLNRPHGYEKQRVEPDPTDHLATKNIEMDQINRTRTFIPFISFSISVVYL